MNINLTLIGQAIAFAIFVMICMKYIWPPLTAAMRERQKAISEGLERATTAERQLEQANEAAAKELEEAKAQGAALIAQAEQRSKQIVDEAKKARDEGDRLIAAAQAEIDQEVNRAREELRGQVSTLAIEGAEKILEKSVDREVHRDMLNQLAAQL